MGKELSNKMKHIYNGETEIECVWETEIESGGESLDQKQRTGKRGRKS
jgi:hypothetical protein